MHRLQNALAQALGCFINDQERLSAGVHHGSDQASTHR